MGRLHSKGKGISASAIPYSRAVPAWFKSTPEQVVDNICKLAKKGATPSQIGVVLRDSHGVAQVKVITGMSPCPIRLYLEANFIRRQQDPQNPQRQRYAHLHLSLALISERGLQSHPLQTQHSL
jgi:hypothetical protein